MVGLRFLASAAGWLPAVALTLAAALPGQGPGGPPDPALLAIVGDRGAARAERIQALEILALRQHPLPLETLLRVRELSRGEGLEPWLRCLGLCGPGAVPELRPFLKRRDPRVRAEAAYALIRLDAEGGEDLGRELLAARRQAEEVRVAALRALAERASPFARVLALRSLESARGAFLLECLAVLRRKPEEGDAPYLVDFLERSEGRARREAVALLQELTGYRIGDDPKTWRYFYLKHRTEGTPFRLEDGTTAREAPTLSYHGIPVLGAKVVFVLDASGSMEAVLPEVRRGPRTRAARAVEELAGLLPRLPEDAAFDLVFFGTEVRSFAGDLVPRQPETLAEATRFLRNQVFDGGTNLYGGLAEAFRRPGVEEIFLLSDGEATQGELVRAEEILARVERWNRWRNVRVNTVALGATPAAIAFLNALARRHDGICRVIH